MGETRGPSDWATARDFLHSLPSISLLHALEGRSDEMLSLSCHHSVVSPLLRAEGHGFSSSDTGGSPSPSPPPLLAQGKSGSQQAVDGGSRLFGL